MAAIPTPIYGLLKVLPNVKKGESWNKETRDKFYYTFGEILDYCIPIKEEHDE